LSLASNDEASFDKFADFILVLVLIAGSDERVDCDRSVVSSFHQLRSSRSKPISSIIGFLDFIDHAAFNVVNGVSNIVQASRLLAEVSDDIEVESFVFISELRVKTTYQVHISLIGIVKVFFVESSGMRSLRAFDYSEAIVS